MEKKIKGTPQQKINNEHVEMQVASPIATLGWYNCNEGDV